jgi:tRNA 2-selenouridine synthase SelU
MTDPKPPKTLAEISKIVEKRGRLDKMLTYLDKSEIEDRTVGSIWEHAQQLLDMLQEYLDDAVKKPKEVKTK